MMMGEVGEMALARQDDCACPFDGPGDTPPVTDPKGACFEGNQRAFLMSRYGQEDINQTLCQSIADAGSGGTAFYALYYLDHKWCGLQWNDPHSLAQDPGVDNIINLCNGLGFPNFADPGVPPESYRCSTCSSSTPKQETPAQSSGFTALSVSSTSKITQPGATKGPPIASASTASLSPSRVDATGTSPPPTATHDTDTFLPTSATTTSATPSRTLPTEAIVAIVVCTTLALVSAVVLLICVLRRRQRQLGEHEGDIRSRISRIVQGFTAADFPQRLISPSHSYYADRPPLTPPLPLRDRKLLPSLLESTSRPNSIASGLPFERYHSNNSQSSCYSSHRQDDKESFPSSPICSPTYNRLEPRQERMHQTAPSLVTSAASLTPEPSSPPYTRLKSPPPVMFTFPSASHDNTTHALHPYPKGRTSSLRNEIVSMTSTNSSNHLTHERHPTSTSTATIALADGADHHLMSTGTSAPTPPSSPVRPRRPHDGPLEIPDLVSPMSTPGSPSPGPPPSKALPPPPLTLRSSPVNTGIGVATTTGVSSERALARSPPEHGQRGPAYQGRRHHSHNRHDRGSAAVERVRGASQDSWGSWEDLTPASLIGRAISPPAGRTVYPYPDT
ncbi:hypothetical protein KVR01_009643 [Diaporthe batatas]|uniref:uncharacterized protein n=1 Tax=Diaporthe batatas TaxID=748121 RepID=UPI001D0443D1|nr:uncharacterized protein KVR01_009643 [Diaporthe batatas]KAG8160107.1 hypothetical protein KVR01_009643 [Diaporthe batatas]